MKKIYYIYNLLLLFLFLFLLNYYSYVSKYNINELFNKKFNRKFRNEKILFLVVFTSNVYEEVMNFYYSSIKKLNIINVIFLSLDREGYFRTHFVLPNVYMAYKSQNISQHIDYGTKLYWKIVYSKTDYVKFLIIKGYSVILCDTDLNFLKDPRDYVLKYNTDLVASCDHRCPSMNSGF